MNGHATGEGSSRNFSGAISASRALAAAAVVAFHGYLWMLAPWEPSMFSGGAANLFQGISHLNPAMDLLYPVFGLGFLGVNLFFVISGFCIHLPNARNTAPLDYGTFFVRRFFRIYPLYIIVCAILFVLYGPIQGRYVEKGVDLKNILGHIIMWHYWGGDKAAGMGISVVTWTLAIEVHFYFIYAILLPTIKKLGIGKVTVAWLLFDAAYRAAFFAYPEFFDYHPILAPARFSPARFGEWLAGAWLAEQYCLGHLPRIKKGLWLACAGCAVIGGGALIGALANVDKYLATDIPACIGFTLILQALLGMEAAGHLNVGRAMNWLGDRSYSLYLTHAPILLTASKVLPSIHKKMATDSIAIDIAVFLAAISISVFVAHIAYISIERPSHQYARKLANKMRIRRNVKEISVEAAG